MWVVVGLILFLLGMAVSIVATVNFVKTPMNQPVTTGAYRYSRHPIYVALITIYLSVSLASASWVFLLFTALLVVEVSLSVIEEERFCLEKYGEAYREYMNVTPRWLGLPKSRRE
jgi:protein-S-isoprenylcysteine O-methyltransferase Ste14